MIHIYITTTKKTKINPNDEGCSIYDSQSILFQKLFHIKHNCN